MRWILAILLAQAAAPRGGNYILPPLGATTLGGVKGTGAALVCTGTDKVTGFNASGTLQCGADVGGTASPGGLSGNIQTNDGLGGFGVYPGVACAYAVKTLDASGAASCTAAPTIPADISGEQYWTAAASANLSAEKSLGGFTALVLNTAGTPSGYAGTSCTNQFPRSMNGSGAASCASVGIADLSATGTPDATTFLRGDNTWATPAGGSGAPTTATYIVQTADGTLTNEQALGALGTGLLKNTTTTGVLSIAAAGTDYQAPLTLPLSAANGGTGTSQGLGGCVTLNTATGAATTVGPVTWTGTFNNLFIEYEITGYSGSAVGRILVGGASISTSALTNGTSAYEGVAGTLTNSLSIPGAPLAVTVSAIGRAGTMNIRGRSGALKRYEIYGQNGNASVSAASTVYHAVGNFSDLGTNLPIQRAQLTVYATLATTTPASTTFNSGTTITVIGCP